MDDFIGTIAIGFIFFALGICGGCECGKAFMKNQAVEAHVAEFYLDDKHDKQFRYLIPRKEKEEAKK